ncbi:MAG: ATP-dependent zinc metalloprotease FtsH [Candidatus Paceibacterota bacterium]|jgi:cell division protease FtsH
MKSIGKNIFLAINILLAIAIIFALFSQFQKSVTTLSLDELATKINNHEVSKISVNSNNLSITLKNGQTAVATKELETSLSETLKNYGVNPAALQQVKIEIVEASGFKYWAGVLIPILLPLLIIGVFFWLMFRQAKTGVNQAFSFGRANIKIFNPFKNRVTFDDVAGLKEAKQELIEVVDFLKNPKKYLDMGARIPRGVLLLGSPGTGKTLLARAVAGEANVPFFYMSASEFVEMFVGVGASRVRDLFQTAKKVGRSIIFIDEIDAIGRERGAGLGGGHDEREQTLNQILVEMDGFEREDTRIVIAATNRPDVLDSALLRPGRFDRRIILDLPDINDREAILKIHSRGKPLAKDVDLRKVGIRTPGFSGAELANLMNEAAILAATKNTKLVTQDNLYASIEKVVLGPERRSKAVSQKEREITAYHEAGHALVTAGLLNTDPVHKISIVSRGMVGGYTMNLPSEDRHLRTKSQFLSDLAILFGGYVSEQKVFNDLSTGASSDLKQSSELAKKLVTKYGMSEKLGPMTFGKTDEMVFLGREIAVEKDYSESVAKEIDAEIKNFVNRSYKTTQNIIQKYRKALDKIAQVLMEKETLEGEEFYNLLKPYKIKPIAV